MINFKPYWYLVLAVIFAAVWVDRRLEHSRVGRAWVAIREDEDVAELMGVPTYRFRLWAFSIGAAIGRHRRGALRRPGQRHHPNRVQLPGIHPGGGGRGARRLREPSA